MNTVSGTIKVKDLQGSVDANSVSGAIILKEISDAKDVEANSVSGDIEYQGNLNRKGTYEFNTHSGDIDLILPSDAAFEVDAETFSGHVESSMEIKISGKVNRRKLSGVVGDGGPNLELSTFSGNIKINNK
ncbi:DUF4097 domain-containing protein, partial [candidate division CSSED10-310 bacterium]